MIIPIFHNNEPMSFKFSTNFLLPYVRKPAKYGGRGSIGLDATPTVLIHICHPVEAKSFLFQYIYCAYLGPKIKLRVFPQFCQNIHFFNCFGYNRDYRVAWINNNKHMIFGLQERLAQFHQDFPSSSYKSPSFGKSYSTRYLLPRFSQPIKQKP